MLAAVDTLNETSLYTTEHGFSAAKFEETVWERLLPGDAEGYRYHLAFELARVPGIRTGYIAVKRGGIVVCLAPYFIQEHVRDSLAEAWSALPECLEEGAQEKTRLRLLSVGSPVTHGCKLGIAGDYQFDPEMVDALYAELNRIGRRMQVDAIVFREVLQQDADRLSPSLKIFGFTKLLHQSLAIHRMHFSSLDEYFASLGDGVRRRLLEIRDWRGIVEIHEYVGMPPDLEQVYALHAGNKIGVAGVIDRLNPLFFESVAALMPHQCRYVLYRAEGKLIGFNLLLHRDHVLIDKYAGIDPEFEQAYGLRDLMWLHNMGMGIREGFHTYLSGYTSSRRMQLGAASENTYIFFRWL